MQLYVFVDCGFVTLSVRDNGYVPSVLAVKTLGEPLIINTTQENGQNIEQEASKGSFHESKQTHLLFLVTT